MRPSVTPAPVTPSFASFSVWRLGSTTSGLPALRPPRLSMPRARPPLAHRAGSTSSLLRSPPSPARRSFFPLTWASSPPRCLPALLGPAVLWPSCVPGSTAIAFASSADGVRPSAAQRQLPLHSGRASRPFGGSLTCRPTLSLPLAPLGGEAEVPLEVLPPGCRHQRILLSKFAVTPNHLFFVSTHYLHPYSSRDGR